MWGLLVNVFTTVLAYSLVLTVSLWCWFQWKKWDFLQAARRLPCTVRTLPFIGHTLYVLQGWEGLTKLAIKEFSIPAVSKGLYNICFWCGPLPLVMIHKLEDIQKVLTTYRAIEKGDELDMFKYAAGNGLLTAPGHIWKVTRRHISPLFHPRNIEQLMTMFNQNSRELVAELASHVDGKSVDMLHPAMSVALKSVCQLIFGTELNFDTQSKEFKGMMKIVEVVPSIFIKRCVKPWLRIDCIFRYLYRKELKEIEVLLKEFIESPLKRAKTSYKNKQINDSSDDSQTYDLFYEGTLNLVDVYTELQKKYPQFTEEDFKRETMTLCGTGSDTVGATVSSCLLLLAKYPDIQGRVYEEISSVVGPDDDVTTAHVSRMQYLDQVYKETLRWAIIVPYISRKSSEEYKLSNCTIPDGSDLLICLVGPHMDPTIYPEPEKFDPERFSPENSSSRAKHAFIPFAAGSRMCIGKTYSDYLIKTILVHVLRRYRLSTDMDVHEFKRIYVVTLVNSNGYNIKFQKRV